MPRFHFKFAKVTTALGGWQKRGAAGRNEGPNQLGATITLSEAEDSEETKELKRRVAELHWTHILDLGATTTPGQWRPGDLVALGCPSDMRGMRVLDLCAADGGYSFQAERLGADYVLATDSFLWGECPGTSKAAFDLARDVLGSTVDSKYLDVLDHSPETVGGTFDLVLFLGVLYHMRHPLLALERLFSVTRSQALIQTHVDMLDYDRPAMAFYPGDELNNDPSNWWGPNVQAVEAMLRHVGFKKIELLSLIPYEALDRRLAVFLGDGTKVEWSGRQQGRGIWHAWR